ncbi:hypothetical protein WP8S17C03_13920 [Metapseudomonas otitidis]|uniref:Uncharacterized protein n=1 Tax=Metapseudomonas otitidis TaxID=319939 RepID=A0A6S5RK26_9GAMM|nr:hypothetical protein [Pseudomonas otitidis]BBT15343.1 hypothetical protein WP8S17C03_13920 [Pseudomonas otitidis]
MKFLDDILQSISGNTKTRIEDPFIGAFIGSWIICNWNRLAILVWGDGTASERISDLERYFKEADLIGFNAVFIIPLCMTLLFLFAFPWVSLALKSMQKFANERLYQQAISIEIGKVKQQEILNKQMLLADPNKIFLEQSVQLDIERRREIIKQLEFRSVMLKEKTEAVVASAAEAKSRANQAALDEEKKKNNAALERQRFNVASAQLKSAQASNRFPSSYSLMLSIEESLKADGVQLSLAGLGEIVAMAFGYKDFHSLVHDENFNNERLSKVLYVYYSPKEFASSLEAIIQNEVVGNEELGVDFLFDHVMSVFESVGYKLLAEADVEEACRDICESTKYDLLNGDKLSGVMAESDTIYDEVEIGGLDSIVFNNGLSVTFAGSASGYHRRDSDVPGRDIRFNMEIKSNLLVGTRALGGFELGEVSASLTDYDCEDEGEAEHLI